MDRPFLAALALRLLGLFTLLQAVWMVGPLVSDVVDSLTSQGGFSGWWLGSAFSAVVMLACGLALLRWAPAIAARWAGPGETDAAPPSPTARGLEVVGYRLLGVYMIVSGLPSLASRVGSSVASASFSTSGSYLTLDLFSSFLAILLGLWLVLGARGLAGLLDRLRGAGLQESEQGWKTREP